MVLPGEYSPREVVTEFRGDGGDSSRPATSSAARSSLQLEPLELAAVATMNNAMAAGLMALKQVQARVSAASALSNRVSHAWTPQNPNM
mmetsp:Transcript_34141/g.62603  ORF Transcript_34141/g.62603 Transcript_34141/m.62603 type:complete len:89 (-) Transcript_34141:44-310(-)